MRVKKGGGQGVCMRALAQRPVRIAGWLGGTVNVRGGALGPFGGGIGRRERNGRFGFDGLGALGGGVSSRPLLWSVCLVYLYTGVIHYIYTHVYQCYHAS